MAKRRVNIKLASLALVMAVIALAFSLLGIGTVALLILALSGPVSIASVWMGPKA